MEDLKVNYKEKLEYLIPGGAHTYSRGADQYPSNAPQLLVKGKDTYVWDAYGNKFLDFGMALRAVTIGYGYEPVAEAALAQIRNGNNLTRPSLIELEAAELICDLIPWVDMVKFAKNGSNVTTAAIKLSRAYTGRTMVARCRQHPFFSFDDWFIGDTPMDGGIPYEEKANTLSFDYNDLSSLKALFEKYPNKIACVILEPATTEEPLNNFLHKVKDLCKKENTVFILDEMITGFRWHIQGASKYYDVEPDLVTYGKAMANGFSLAALGGKREIMELGGLHHSKERVFLISTTHGAEMSSLGAFVETVKQYTELGVIDQIEKSGTLLINGINEIANGFGIQDYFKVVGTPFSPNYLTFDESKNLSLELRTLFAQEMIKNKVLIPWIALSWSHKENEVNFLLNAVYESLKVYKNALDKGVMNYLNGPVIKPIFRKYN